RLRIWDVATGRVRKEIQGPAGIFRTVTVSPDGRRVAATAVDLMDRPNLRVCDVGSGECLYPAEGGALAYSPDGRWLAVRDAAGRTVLLLDARPHKTAPRFSGHEKFVYWAAFSPDSRHLASCSRDRTVRVWQIDPLTLPSPPSDGGEGRVRECQVLRGHTDEVFTAAF